MEVSCTHLQSAKHLWNQIQLERLQYRQLICVPNACRVKSFHCIGDVLGIICGASNHLLCHSIIVSLRASLKFSAVWSTGSSQVLQFLFTADSMTGKAHVASHLMLGSPMSIVIEQCWMVCRYASISFLTTTYFVGMTDWAKWVQIGSLKWGSATFISWRTPSPSK